MALLERWRQFMSVPQKKEFPRLELMGRDFEPPIIAGSGEIRMPSLWRFEFTLEGLPDDVGYALGRIRESRQNPHDWNARFRLKGTDETGIEWSLGWVVFNVQADDEKWILTGETQSLEPPPEDSLDEEPSTEVVFWLPRYHPVGQKLSQFMQRAVGARPLRLRHELGALNSTILFEYEPVEGFLSIRATVSKELSFPYAENWLSEPLRILSGQLLFPRLTARNFGNGRSVASIRPSPDLLRNPISAAIWENNALFVDGEDFWKRYRELLCVVARAKDKDSRPNFEAHNITRLYDEFNQAARGTRWVWTMTCASCAEGLVKLLEPRSQPRSDADHEAIDDIIKHVGSWPGHDRFAKDEVRRLKEAATRALRNAGMTTTALNLKNLVASGAVTREQFDAWDAIRNRVMHGNLISPYARDEDETNMLLELAGLMHTLTLEILRRSPDSG